MEEFCQLAGEVVAALPEPFHAYLQNTVVDVEPWPPRRVLDEMGIESRYDLFGLFEGVAVTEQGFGERTPNRVWLFKNPIEAACRSREEIAYEIRRTVLHELAHHFGYSEEDLEEFESQPNPFDDPDA